MKPTQLVDLFQLSRKSQTDCVIEGVQALKHAVRFGANIKRIITCDINMLTNHLHDLAPDISQMVLSSVAEVEEHVFEKLSPQPPRTKVIALAARKSYTPSDIDTSKPIIFLEDPRDLENIGAVIRVAAGADAAAVVISGAADVWHPAVIRGAAGLQYALPVCDTSLSGISENREIISLDPGGEDIRTQILPKNPILVFGTERYGIKQDTLRDSTRIVRLPMKEGVSSLNLATSVAATLYMM